jgi:hypothetical protein
MIENRENEELPGSKKKERRFKDFCGNLLLPVVLTNRSEVEEHNHVLLLLVVLTTRPEVEEHNHVLLLLVVLTNHSDLA